MARKVIISFLGTSKYKECVYSSSEKGESKVVQYVQTAIFDLYCKDFSKNDIAFVFLTDEAKEKNWEELKNEIGERVFTILPINDVPEGYSESEIWNIFEIVYQKIKKDDEIILDVTHSFRSLPMLQIVLLNFAQTLKNVKISNILYGAFEAIGVPAYQIEKQIPDPVNRIAPLLDLTTFSAIQSWTFAAQSFIQTGNPNAIRTLSMDNIKPILKESKGSDKTALNLRNLMEAINNIQSIINTNRGRKIIESNEIQKAKEAIENLNGDEMVFAPIKPLLKQIRDKLIDFDKMPHWEAAVKWCINHEMIQQGITQFQEGIISFICEEFGLKPEKLEDREIVSQSLNILDRNIKEDEWKEPSSSHKDTVKKLIIDSFIINHKSNYSKLTQLRNDINHAGYKENSLNDGKVFQTRLNEIFNEFLRIKGGNKTKPNALVTPMLLNLSNHPSSNWPKNQMQAAIQQFGSVEDLAFPPIDPNWTSDEVNLLVDTYEVKIRKINPAAVHIMGEMTFIFQLVYRLKEIGFPCIASTTERVATEDEQGNKISQFNFVQFRPY
ncbi:MAG: TIGR02221 family CRISPR-associated protein [Chitinophagales bacterium]|nr:TIGR02221 family CRISPR-associated protein [Chitinophagales bacterium]